LSKDILALVLGGLPLKIAKNISPPIITKLSGLVDITHISVNTKFERKNDQKLTFSFHMHQIFGLLVKIVRKITSWESSVCQIILRHALAFKYFLILSKTVSLKFGQVKSIKTLPFITILTWPVLLAFASI